MPDSNPSTTSHSGVIAVSVKDVFKAFGETKALSGCSFEARHGEIHAIVGENGSGKSTLAKILSGVYHPDAGQVSIMGAAPNSPVAAKRLGVSTIFQEVLVADEATVLENLFVGVDGLLRATMTRAKKREMALEVMGRFAGHPVDPDVLVGELPLNLKQWVVIGRAILSNPKVLILDESSAALDLDATTRLHDELRRLRDQGTCIIIVTHRIVELIRVADHATVLRDGQTVGELRKADITEQNLLALMTAQGRVSASVDSGSTGSANVDSVNVDSVSAGSANSGSASAGSTHRLESPQESIILEARELRVTPEAKPTTFSLRQGEIVGLTGLDGHGQDRFIRMIAGIESASNVPASNASTAAGHLMVTNTDGTPTPLRNLADADRLKVAYVSGDRKKEGIFPNLSIFENFALSLYPKHLNAGGWIAQRPLARAFAHEVQRLGIKFGHQTDRITSLSGGNQQKVLIARALASQPRIIVLNDPARGVDLGTKRELYAQLRSFAAQGGAVVYLSSEIEEFFNLAHRVDVFRHDSIGASLSEQEITEDRMLAAMFGHAGPLDLEMRPKEISPEEISPEERFA